MEKAKKMLIFNVVLICSLLGNCIQAIVIKPISTQQENAKNRIVYKTINYRVFHSSQYSEGWYPLTGEYSYQINFTYGLIWNYISVPRYHSIDAFYYTTFCDLYKISDIALQIQAKCQFEINRKVGRNATTKEIAQSMLDYVQSLSYQIDDLSNDYPKYPLETIFDGGGDCEDTAILFGSLCKVLAYDCILILCRVKDENNIEKTGHVQIGIALNQTNWSYDDYSDLVSLPFDDEQYLICETTAGAKMIGEKVWKQVFNVSICKI